MRVLVSGSHGLIGRRLMQRLLELGHTPVPLVRSGGRSSQPDARVWNPDSGLMDAPGLIGIDAVVHLAGESIAEGRWTAAKKKRIRDSRVNPTRHLAQLIVRESKRPSVFVTASAIGFYGNRGDETLDETAAPGRDYLADVCAAWEAAARPAADAGVRVVHVRTGIVLDGAGGALAKLKWPFLLGAGGRLGDGRQIMSWISIEDIVNVFAEAVCNETLNGPVNGVGPQPASNDEFTRTLSRVLHRPALFPAPRAAMRLLLGEMADALLFSSQRVVPARLQKTGFRFRHPTLESALRAALGR
jgi:uncharacterized protein (TIGR01777 family)